MHEDSFWDNAAKSLPAPVRDRYIAYFEMAKRWELAWDAAFEAWLGIKAWVAGLFKFSRPPGTRIESALNRLSRRPSKSEASSSSSSG